MQEKLHMLEPLNKILGKDSSREWTDYDKKAFEEVKSLAKEKMLLFSLFGV